MKPGLVRSVLLGSILAVVVLVGARLWFDREPAVAPRADAAAADTGVAPSRDAAGAGRQAPAVALGDAADNETMMTLRREQQRRDVDKVIAAGRSKIAGTYDSETVDRQWAGGKQRRVEALQSNAQIEQLNARPVAFDVACRTTTCRIQADFTSRLAADDWVTLFMLNAGAELSNSSVDRTDLPDGSVNVEIYSQAR